jgi:hypothetical protein
MKLTGAFILLVLLMTSAAKFEHNALSVVVPREIAQASSSEAFASLGNQGFLETRLTDVTLQPQILVKQQNPPGKILQRYTYENIRVTVFERGIIAGDLRTGKVIWRLGFAPNPDHEVLPESLNFFGHYFIYCYDYGKGVFGSLVDINTGKSILEATAVLALEDSIVYLRNFDYFNYESRYFADIQIIRFDTVNQSKKRISFVVDQYVDSSCGDWSKGAINLNFTEKVEDRWFFEFSDEKCDVALNFNLNNINYNSVEVVQKERK